MKKIFTKVGLVLGAGIFLVLIFAPRSQGFTPRKIQSKYYNDPKWEAAEPSNEEMELVHSLLQKPFTYLGSGNHCYVFLSEDQNYVIKFFKQNKMKTQIWENFIPLPEKLTPQRLQKLAERRKERDHTFTSYKIAYEHLKEETNLLYLHLNKTQNLNQTLTIYDQHGKKHTFPADRMEFLIQKKADVGFKQIAELIDHNQITQAMDALSSLLTLIEKRISLGIHDRDMQIFKNFGFVNGKAQELDIGEFCFETNAKDTKEEHAYIYYQIQSWMAEHYPHLLPRLESLLKKYDLPKENA